MPGIRVDSDSELYLIGIQIDNDAANPQLYVLYLDSDAPISCNGFPLIFFTPKKANEALAISDCGCNSLSPPPSDQVTCLDISQAVYSIAIQDKATDGSIVHCINLLLDFIAFLHEDRVHQRFKALMCTAADYFTFNDDINDFFTTNNFDRKELVQAIEWSLGAALLWAKYVY